MKRKTFLTSILCFILIFAFSAHQLGAQDVIAKWDDKSDELPGMASDGAIIGLAVGGAVLITGLVVLLVVKKKQDNKLKDTSPDVNGINAQAIGISKTPGSLYDEICKAGESSPIKIFADVNKVPVYSSGNNMSMSVGLRFKF